jgi:hypothetical protein
MKPASEQMRLGLGLGWSLQQKGPRSKKKWPNSRRQSGAEIKQERVYLNRDKLNFADERVKLIAQIAALKRELEVRPKVWINKSP